MKRTFAMKQLTTKYIKQFMPLLKQTFLFDNCTDTDVYHIVECLCGYVKKYQKNQIIYNLYDNIEYAGVVLSGEINAVMVNSNDNELVIRKFTDGGLFCADYACIPDEKSDVQIVTKKDSLVLFLKTSNLFLDSAIRCEHASKATANLLKESVRNNIFQTRKVQILSQKHIRERLMLYFNGLRDNSTDKNKHIHIPFNRQELADYLGVERSALSREMGRMKDEGIIDYNKQDIILN